MTLDEKIKNAVKLIQDWMDWSERPIVMSSFGKDSMVLLEMCRLAGHPTPEILFFREPFFPEKYRYANNIILQKNLTVHQYPPSKISLVKVKGATEIAKFYQFGDNEAGLYLPMGVVEPRRGNPFVCGADHICNHQTGSLTFPWDTVFIGHKSSDVDPLLGGVELMQDKTEAGGINVVFPLRHFTDDDIWACHEKFYIPVHTSRYHAGKERENKTFNPDYFPVCLRCVDPDQPDRVICPLDDQEIESNAIRVEQVTVQVPEYVRRQE